MFLKRGYEQWIGWDDMLHAIVSQYSGASLICFAVLQVLQFDSIDY